MHSGNINKINYRFKIPHLNSCQVYAGEDWSRCDEVSPSNARQGCMCPSTTQEDPSLAGQ